MSAMRFASICNAGAAHGAIAFIRNSDWRWCIVLLGRCSQASFFLESSVEPLAMQFEQRSPNPINLFRSGLRVVALAWTCHAACAWAVAIDTCEKKVYLTFNTGDMENAPLVADILQRQHVRASFFASNQRTAIGDASLGNYWAPWWKAQAAQGHQFASLTYDHVFWRSDLPGAPPRYRVRLTSGALEGREFTWEAGKYCEQITHAAQRLSDFTGKKSLPLFRAPGGAISPSLLNAARACGYAHVGWAAAGALGDQLPSEKISNDDLLQQALRDIRSGDILVATLGTSTRKDPWAPAVLEPLIVGLRAQGFCFDTLRSHPGYKDWIASHGK
jgi:peptidoglycan/xylan/chitin deacetylase (PgdA/CDA1 family)